MLKLCPLTQRSLGESSLGENTSRGKNCQTWDKIKATFEWLWIGGSAIGVTNIKARVHPALYQQFRYTHLNVPVNQSIVTLSTFVMLWCQYGCLLTVWYQGVQPVSIPAYTISQIHYMLSHLIFVWLEVKCMRLRCSKRMKGLLELTQSWPCRRCHMITASEIFGIWTSSLTHSDHFALRSKTNGSSNPTPASLWRWVLLHRSNGQLAVSRSWHQQHVCRAAAAVRR